VPTVADGSELPPGDMMVSAGVLCNASSLLAGFEIPSDTVKV